MSARDPTTGRESSRLVRPAGAVSCLLARAAPVSPASELSLWVGMCDGMLSAHRRQGSEKHEVRAHASRVHALCEAGGLVWSAGADSLIKAWCVVRCDHLRTCRAHSGPVRCLCALEPLSDGSSGTVWSGADDHTLRVWSVDGTGGAWTAQDGLCARPLGIVPQDAAVRALCALSVPQPRVWVADEAGALTVWHGESRALLRTVVAPGSAEARVGCMASSEEGLWCGDDRGGLRLYDALSTALLARHAAAHQHPLQHIAAATVGGSHGGRLGVVWAAYGDSTVHAWRVLESLPQHARRVGAAVEAQRKGIGELQRRLPEALAQAAGQLAAAETRSALLGKQVSTRASRAARVPAQIAA